LQSLPHNTFKGGGVQCGRHLVEEDIEKAAKETLEVTLKGISLLHRWNVLKELKEPIYDVC
jgi:hypothetical protein